MGRRGTVGENDNDVESAVSKFGEPLVDLGLDAWGGSRLRIRRGDHRKKEGEGVSRLHDSFVKALRPLPFRRGRLLVTP